MFFGPGNVLTFFRDNCAIFFRDNCVIGFTQMRINNNVFHKFETTMFVLCFCCMFLPTDQATICRVNFIWICMCCLITKCLPLLRDHFEIVWRHIFLCMCHVLNSSGMLSQKITRTDCSGRNRIGLGYMVFDVIKISCVPHHSKVIGFHHHEE